MTVPEEWCNAGTASGKRKVCHRSFRAASVGARLFARKVSGRQEIVENIYAYPCPRCEKWHLTRRSHWDGAALALVFEAAPVEMQQWAMRGRRP